MKGGRVVKPKVAQFEVEDGVNEAIVICLDRDADLGVVSFTLDQRGGEGYIYVTLEGLEALVEAARGLVE